MKKAPTHNVSIAVFDGSDIAQKWDNEMEKLNDKKKVSVMGRAALRHFLFVLTDEQRESLFLAELSRKSADEEAARRLHRAQEPLPVYSRMERSKKAKAKGRDAG